MTFLNPVGGQLISSSSTYFHQYPIDLAQCQNASGLDYLAIAAIFMTSVNHSAIDWLRKRTLFLFQVRKYDNSSCAMST